MQSYYICICYLRWYTINSCLVLLLIYILSSYSFFVVVLVGIKICVRSIMNKSAYMQFPCGTHVSVTISFPKFVFNCYSQYNVFCENFNDVQFIVFQEGA